MRRSTLAPVLFVLALAALFLLAATYMGAYYGMVKPNPRNDFATQRAVPVYRTKSQIVAAAFWPAYQIDRLIREAHWRFDANDICGDEG